MGIFGPKRQHRNERQAHRPTITHRASWNGNSATFYINPEGVTFSFAREPRIMIDDVNLEAALAQLERAYHLAVSFPDAESQIMEFLRSVNPDIPETAIPHFEWMPLLPGEKQES